MCGYYNRFNQVGVNLPDEIVMVLHSHYHQVTKNFVMNYNMQGMTKVISELFAMLKLAKVEIKKDHQVLMVKNTTSFKKKGKGKKGNFMNGKTVAAPVRNPKNPNPRRSLQSCIFIVQQSGQRI